MNNNLLETYKERFAKFNAVKTSLKKKLRIYTFLRLFTFLGIFIGFYVILESSVLWAILTGALFLILFLILVKKFIVTSNLFEYNSHLVDINENEIKALNDDFSVFEGGKEYINKEHDFTFDLDVFGEGSLFQFLNRSAIQIGYKKLAELLRKLTKDVKLLYFRQNAITEIAEKLSWRQEFIAKGKMSVKNEAEINKLYTWLKSPVFFKRKRLVKAIMSFLTILTLVLVSLSIFKVLPYSFIALTIIYQLVFYTFLAKDINRYHLQISKYSSVLDNYSKLLYHIESEKWTSEMLKDLAEELKAKRVSSVEIKKLSSLVSAMDSRLSPLMGFLLNWLLMWDLHYIMKIEKWKIHNKDFVKTWFDILAEFDAIQSFGNYKYNHPKYSIPTIKESGFSLQTKDLGHPLIPEKERVCNDFESIEYGRFSIITGANMAGKSTFLRTVGVNLILAMNGAPVCAESFTFSPINIFSSMRTDDSLQRNKSYFFSELERLKAIFDKINSGDKLFLILDEILKGTNSKDKEIGSKAFLKKLIKLKANGIIATHDLTLGELEQEHPEYIINQCFEVKMTETELDFDYKLYPGITKNLNASYLLKKMGIV